MPILPVLRDAWGEAVPGRPATSLADWLVQQRQARGWQQRDVAARLGVHQSMVGLWEMGRRTIPAARLVTLAAVFGTRVDALPDSPPPAEVVRAEPAWCLDVGEGCPCPRWTCLACGACWTGQAGAHRCSRMGTIG